MSRLHRQSIQTRKMIKEITCSIIITKSINKERLLLHHFLTPVRLSLLKCPREYIPVVGSHYQVMKCSWTSKPSTRNSSNSNCPKKVIQKLGCVRMVGGIHTKSLCFKDEETTEWAKHSSYRIRWEQWAHCKQRYPNVTWIKLNQINLCLNQKRMAKRVL